MLEYYYWLYICYRGILESVQEIRTIATLETMSAKGASSLITFHRRTKCYVVESLKLNLTRSLFETHTMVRRRRGKSKLNLMRSLFRRHLVKRRGK